MDDVLDVLKSVLIGMALFAAGIFSLVLAAMIIDFFSVGIYSCLHVHKLHEELTGPSIEPSYAKVADLIGIVIPAGLSMYGLRKWQRVSFFVGNVVAFLFLLLGFLINLVFFDWESPECLHTHECLYLSEPAHKSFEMRSSNSTGISGVTRLLTFHEPQEHSCRSTV